MTDEERASAIMDDLACGGPTLKADLVWLFYGNMSELARTLGISRQAVWKWPESKPVPAWWGEKVTGNK